MHYDLRLPPAQPATDFRSHSSTKVSAAIAFTNRTGPVVLPGAGHFLQWERADLFNPLVTAFFGDLRVRRAR